MMRDADTALHGTSVKLDPSLASNYMAAESEARAAGHLSERESVFCIRFLKRLKSPARSTAYSVPGAPVWQARALRPAGPSLRLKRIYRRSGGLPIVPAAVSGCSSLSAAMIYAATEHSIGSRRRSRAAANPVRDRPPVCKPARQTRLKPESRLNIHTVEDRPDSARHSPKRARGRYLGPRIRANQPR